MVTILWVLNVTAYPKLRKLEGCENYVDIPASKNMEEIQKLKKMVVYDHEFIDENPFNSDVVQTTFKEILKLCRKLTAEGKPHILTFYGSGYGITVDAE